MGRHIEGCNGVYGWYGVDQRNLEGRMLLDVCLEKELCVKDMVYGRGKRKIKT